MNIMKLYPLFRAYIYGLHKKVNNDNYRAAYIEIFDLAMQFILTEPDCDKYTETEIYEICDELTREFVNKELYNNKHENEEESLIQKVRSELKLNKDLRKNITFVSNGVIYTGVPAIELPDKSVVFYIYDKQGNNPLMKIFTQAELQ